MMDERAFSGGGRTVETFEAACRAHQAGRMREAVPLYRQVVSAEPGHAQAWYLLGVACDALGQADEAIADLRCAVQFQPGHADAHNFLGFLLARQGRLEEAVDCFLRALHARPGWSQALNNLRLAYRGLEERPDAIDALQRAARQWPEDAEVHYRLGMVQVKRGGLEDAAASLGRAVRLDPNHADAHYNLGVALLQRGRNEEAPECFRQALRLRPAWPEAHYNLGVACLKNSLWEEARAGFEKAVQQRPDYADAVCLWGQALVKLDRLDEAMERFGQAIRMQADFPDAWCFRGFALAVGGRLGEALASFEEALRLRPDHAETHFERSLVWLLQGDWQRGLPEYEWRWKTDRFGEMPARYPRWDGSPLEGRTVLLRAEQGYGDTFQFVRYAPLVQQRGGKVVVSCPDGAVPLLSRSPGIDRLVAASTETPPCDLEAPLLSLPLLFGTTPETVPAPVPYLFPDPALVEQWHRELPPGPPFKIGISWQGNPAYRRDHYRSIPLRHFAPVARLGGVQLYSLQKGHGTEQLREFAEQFSVIDLGERLTERAGAFTDTAAVLANLDLLVTSDTAIVHLAGGLGVPVLMALPRIPDWRWLLDREDTPWYPTVRLFRQTERGDWGSVFERIAAAVRVLLQSFQDSRGQGCHDEPGRA
jgi:tetratricopeptide (TPR) repeat protein